MLINRVSEVNDRGEVNGERADDRTQDYQTASELFDIMSQDQQLNVNNDALSASDLVLLYKKFDVGTNLMSVASMTKRPNQHVETVVYGDDLDSEDSDTAEIFNTHDVYEYNKERLDILSNEGLGNTLCQKLGGIVLQSPKSKNEYHQHFNAFQDSLIRDQNYSLGFEDFEGAILPATLLDYICCKRLEDNYNFYMDNIIRYVKHTIEQLKRISNGDYLTDKAKEKWREVSDPGVQTNNTKILATTTSIPLHIERKTSKLVSAWDDIVHSEVDVRSLSKILEKKIIVEVPKLICGTYKLFSRQCVDNLIISCKRENNPNIKEEKENSRVDVVLQLEKSESGHVVSNISSIMILKSPREICVSNPLPLPYKDIENSFFDATKNSSINKLEIVEIKHDNEDCLNCIPNTKQEDMYEVRELDEDSLHEGRNEINEYPYIENDISSKNHSYLESSESNDVFRDIVGKRQSLSEFSYELTSPDELCFAMKPLNIPSSLPEESVDDASQNTLSKKKSPTRIRIKSPYENKSYVLEEKKRRRLLEIREKRERKKMALGENCKISKHKYAKGGAMPQASSSVTKLSITNKSFYNSIYGQTVVVEQTKSKNHKSCNNDPILEVPLDHEGEHNAPVLTPDTKKFISKSYYLDDTETEMMYMQTKQNESSEIKACSASTSVESSDFRANLTLLSQLIGSSGTNLNVKLNQVSSEEKTLFHEISIVGVKEEEELKAITTQSIINLAPTNSPKNESIGVIDAKKASTSVECRKSIDKIYDLMKRLERGEADENDQTKTKLMTVHTDRLNVIGHRVSSTIQGSDSGTSLKHHLTSSNPSCFSFEKTNDEVPKLKSANNKSEIPIVPKVIISNKVQIIKTDGDRNKKPKRPMLSPTLKTQHNPLKAISQLLHEFDSVQKCRQRPGDSRANKKQEITSNDDYSNSYQGSPKRRSRLESHLNDKEVLERTPKVTTPGKLKTSLGIIRSARVTIEENHDKINKRKITDIIDEVKEARGEVVKGPSKINSRLNSLAQPKKSYIQARVDEYTRSSKNLADRQPKLAKATLLPERNMDSINSRNKVKRTGTEAVSLISMKKPPVQPLDKVIRKRRSANSSPENTSKPPSPVSSSKRNNVPPTPETLKKMVAVESSVKNHYRRAPSMMRDHPLTTAHKSRIPLLPKDIELASITSANTAEESTEVGSKLQHVINTMLDIAPGLTVSEDLEITCKRTQKLRNNEQLSRGDERSSIGSDYPVDVFEDKHIATAVDNILNRITEDKITDNVKIFKSATEIEKLENALFRKWPTGAFQKRLRIKNLTLTPKHSMKQVFFLQSGDGSLVIKSSLSKTVHLDAKNEVRDLKALPVLSKTELDWNFTNIPMQIATVGYAFPQYQSPFEPNKIKSLVEVYKTVGPSNDTLESNEDINIIIEQPKLLMGEFPEDKGKTEKSSINVLKVKTEEGKIDLTQDFVDAIKLNERTDMSSLKVLDRDDQALQKPDLKNIDYTTSLDMLMGLLNEIQKITSCQTHITNNDADNQCKELETILDDAATLEALSNNPRELVSMASLDKMRKLESKPSMYTIYLSSDEDSDNNCSNIINVSTDACRTLYVDKEVNVDIGTPECINRFTDVPSLFPININHSTNVTNSVMGVLSRPSSQSMFSFMEYQTLYSNSSVNIYKNIIQLPQHVVANETKERIPKHFSVVGKEKEKLNETPDFDSSKTLPLTDKKKAKKVKQNLIRYKKIMNNESQVPGFDPMLKLKRDILVTVYSILVITVFAALSFPEVVYNV